ncbi:GNAT family N-acetyltransferase [Rhizobium leguminosarum]|uniref:GNAT superfamily N-acetyltransferase n=1 Tax=Rhizobium leguminosarum TaxID=384 RepID=A0A7W9ZX06_RHILE|nr:GNAT family N-acetyltransferase [Rhizobium leguminosarum]MBB5664623.1 GNAT superfamily N-acetyltransferase [Rhizobium leguminosarum]MBB6224361.1 GNAT superfamily N-acetyltransferase [Rhizobium leguminosarum]
MTMRLASPDDLERVATLTAAAYRPYTELFGAPPIPVTEDYTPRIERGEVWLRDVGGETAGLTVVERHSNHLMLFSVAVSPAFQGGGHGLAMLHWLEGKAREWAQPEIRLYTNALMEGRRPNPYRPGWTLVDMTKQIRAA